MNKLFLFDMDGTLTPARQKMEADILTYLTLLQREGWDIGIISGSDMDYIENQCDRLFDLSPINARDIHFLPCTTKAIPCKIYIRCVFLKSYDPKIACLTPSLFCKVFWMIII